MWHEIWNKKTRGKNYYKYSNTCRYWGVCYGNRREDNSQVLYRANKFKEVTLTVHFNRNTCTPAYLRSYPISQSCDRSTVHKIMQIHVMFTSTLAWGKPVISTMLISTKMLIRNIPWQPFILWLNKWLNKWQKYLTVKITVESLLILPWWAEITGSVLQTTFSTSQRSYCYIYINFT